MRMAHLTAVLIPAFLLIASVGPTRAAVLDDIPGAQAAYSLRQLTSAYTGPVVEVRRSSDSATLDIGFVNGQLDTAALLAFAGSGDAFVTTWYDQSGSGYDISRTSAGMQPQIVTSGNLYSNPLSGEPAIRFNNQSLTIGTGDLWNDTLSVIATGSWVDVPTGSDSLAQRLWSIHQGANTRAAAGGNSSQFGLSYRTATHQWAVSGTPIVANQPFVVSYLSDATQPAGQDEVHLHLNGNSIWSNTGLTLGSLAVTDFTVGAHFDNTRDYNGIMQDLILYHSVLSPADRAAVEMGLMSFSPAPNSLLFDFGVSGQTSPGNYNNVLGATSTGTKISGAIDEQGAATAIDLAVTQRFQESVSNGDVSDAAGFHSNAQRDSFYVRQGSSPTYPQAAVRLENLSPELLFDVDLFGSRTSTVGTDRYTVYTIGGVEKVLDTKGNTSEVVRFSDLTADAGGSIDIGVRLLTNTDTGLLQQLGIGSTDTDHGYLSAMRLTATGYNYHTAGQVVAENFNSLANSPNTSTAGWSDGITLPGWYAATADGGAFDSYTVYDGSGVRNNELLSLGAIADDDRALGFQTFQSNAATHYGLRLVNTTGMVLDEFTLGYRGEQWRRVGGEPADSLLFDFQVFDRGEGNLVLPVGWTAVDDLRFDTPNNTGGTATLDGNDPENSALLMATVSDFAWEPGQELWLRWTDPTATWQMLGIDDVWFRAVPEPSSALLLLAALLASLVPRRRAKW